MIVLLLIVVCVAAADSAAAAPTFVVLLLLTLMVLLLCRGLLLLLCSLNEKVLALFKCHGEAVQGNWYLAGDFTESCFGVLPVLSLSPSPP